MKENNISKKKATFQEQGTWLTLAEANAASEQITPDALEQFLNATRRVCHVFEFRIQVARAADDDARVKQLQNDESYLKAKKRKAYFESQLAAQFPTHRIAPFDAKAVEREIVIADYLSAKRLKRDAEILAAAARALDDDTEKKMALQDMQRALKYIKFLEPKFKKIEREQKTA